MQGKPTDYGLCGCGCGEPTKLAPVTRSDRGWTKGQPMPFLIHHAARRRKMDYSVEDRGYTTPCWIWAGTLTTRGYGVTTINYRQYQAHRVFYQQRYGPITLDLDHLCRVHPCVNPDHLEPVTVRENTRRGASAKITLDIARQIVASIGLDESQSAVARRFGVSPQLVCDIKKGRKWPEATLG